MFRKRDVKTKEKVVPITQQKVEKKRFAWLGKQLSLRVWHILVLALLFIGSSAYLGYYITSINRIGQDLGLLVVDDPNTSDTGIDWYVLPKGADPEKDKNYLGYYECEFSKDVSVCRIFASGISRFDPHPFQ